MHMGPAVKLSIAVGQGESEREMQVWVFRDIEAIKARFPEIFEIAPVFNPKRIAPFGFSLKSITTKNFTGLQINGDPGMPVVAVGALLILMGFLVIFTLPRRQVWIRVEQGKKTKISVAGRSSRDPAGLEREIGRIIDRIKKQRG